MMNNSKKEKFIMNTQDQDKKQNIDNILNDYPLDEDYISSTNIFCLKTKHGHIYEWYISEESVDCLQYMMNIYEQNELQSTSSTTKMISEWRIW